MYGVATRTAAINFDGSFYHHQYFHPSDQMPHYSHHAVNHYQNTHYNNFHYDLESLSTTSLNSRQNFIYQPKESVKNTGEAPEYRQTICHCQFPTFSATNFSTLTPSKVMPHFGISTY